MCSIAASSRDTCSINGLGTQVCFCGRRRALGQRCAALFTIGTWKRMQRTQAWGWHFAILIMSKSPWGHAMLAVQISFASTASGV
mmetsp:Transcript_74724/g.207770  ORF Transcript_74724/g.207770 Transcript_74724/m.207770 type:complete len:85 (-) Transcript_74724:650-904(-)